jgi:hypothetical protein
LCPTFNDMEPREEEVAAQTLVWGEQQEGTEWITQEENSSNGDDDAEGTQPNTPNAESKNGNLPDYVTIDANRKLDEVYGDHVHQNSGRHLDGKVADGSMWQNYWERIVVYPSKTYTIPTGAIDKWFIRELVQLLDNTIEQKCNSDKFIVFQMVILQTGSSANRFWDIKRTIKWRWMGSREIQDASRNHTMAYEGVPHLSQGIHDSQAESQNLSWKDAARGYKRSSQIPDQ